MPCHYYEQLGLLTEAEKNYPKARAKLHKALEDEYWASGGAEYFKVISEVITRRSLFPNQQEFKLFAPNQ
ncbi:hypothetical protein BV372_17605 [Nostoc sp. T09]|uniref:hypothetical protein n=1 Tax=Nostoc sp. T09 TaxID=1932621 RepID=UPI000A3D04B6|nr:hypothetical protein [Nostoc sp. T09]OUL33001.1 hypothetical protein BV372_17605 [Nostoc sp. T09]